MKSKGLLVILCITLVIFSCKRQSGNDKSYSIEEYRKIGMPEPDQTWSLNDYISAIKILDNLRTFLPDALPKKDSRKSGEYFARLTDPENLSFIFNEEIPLYERANTIQLYIDVQTSLVTIYTDLDPKEQTYHRELIDLYIFGITISQYMLDLGQRINESVDEKDINMQYAYESIRDMYIKMILFVLGNQKKSVFFLTDDLEKLTDFVANSIDLNLYWMQQSGRKDLETAIREVLDNTSSDHIEEVYGQLLENI